MQSFTINAGTFSSDNQATDRTFSTEAIGQVTLEDNEVQQLIELIRAHQGDTDVEALGLKELYPTIYQKLEAAYRHTVALAIHKINMLVGLHLDVSPISDDQIDRCMTELGYKDQSSSFARFMAHLESLSPEDFDQFMTRHFDAPLDDQTCDGYGVVIPEGIVELV